MVKIFLSGCNGRMGQVIISCVAARDDCEIVGGADIFNEQKNEFPVYSDIKEFDGECDVIIDFSNPAALGGLLEFCLDKKVPACLRLRDIPRSKSSRFPRHPKRFRFFTRLICQSA